ncbi:hypothetical protein HBI67_052180 [Parastagonospora nodorum]|nr:hypothetical protein HBI11_217760 [Parastagonospora nodorum]KAH6075319.1 hypothetical protein HBI67_052180 [Parastagonospora nodorum]KAH6089548.1 hypothetical protein HBI66_027540 [Parastagonospora nodorum]KAH6427114.1 hypothetical protein HBI08_060840 [Parastagonospora nodorum]
MVTGFGVEADRAIVKVSFTKKHSAHTSIPGPTIMFLNNGFSSFGNQFFNTTVQLDAGVRLLTVQVHVGSKHGTAARELRLCHSSCALFDVGSLQDWLWEIRIWLDRNPNEVVTIILVNLGSASATELEGEYSRADLAHYGWVPPNISEAPPLSSESNKTWPTLATMINSGQRLVTFVNPLTPDEANAPYLLRENDFVWENSYAVTAAADFACAPDRVSNTTTISEARDSGKLFLMNLFLYWQQAFGIQTPDRRVLAATNSWDGPGGLDFFNVGPAIESVDIFNGVDPVGRRNVTTVVVDNGLPSRRVNESGSKAVRSVFALVVAAAVTCMVF